MSSTAHPSPSARSPQENLIRSRISNACDGCKARKVKCDGNQPCSYCVRRQRPHACHYTAQRRARRQRSGVDNNTPPSTRAQAPQTPSASANTAPPTRETSFGETDGRTTQGDGPGNVNPDLAEDDTEVPREARLLCDAQGKLIFIGDCAPLSLFQSVRQLVTTRIGQNAFAPETSRFSVLENAPSGNLVSSGYSDRSRPPEVRPADVKGVLDRYIETTTGLIDLFDHSLLSDDLLLWANIDQKPTNLTSIVNYLIFAIGIQTQDEAASRVYFEYARDQAFATLSGDLGVGTVQAFVLITMYMLCSCQINSAFLVFGISVRAAYSVGVHRTEVNARFGPEVHRQRDRLWKSLRVVDLFMSCSMGRPPATSDVDCTVPYRATDDDGNQIFDLLNASVQIMLIVEGIVTEIYSRKKISLQLTEGMSMQLREWSGTWVQRLKNVISQPRAHDRAQVSGACQVLSSYYYAVMLVSRPFLMYELFCRLSEGQAPAGRHSTLNSGKSKLADACIDAASLMVDPVLELIQQGWLTGPSPLIVSWLFAASLVLSVGLLGGFGRILEKYTRMSIEALDSFARSDTHATQYSLIAQSLLTTALEHLEKRELQERLRRTESSSQLFGLIPHDDNRGHEASPVQHIGHTLSSPVTSISRRRDSLDRSFVHQPNSMPVNSPRLNDFDTAFFGLGDTVTGSDNNFWGTYRNENDAGSTLNLFPLLETGGGIDLAHYL